MSALQLLDLAILCLHILASFYPASLIQVSKLYGTHSPLVLSLNESRFCVSRCYVFMSKQAINLTIQSGISSTPGALFWFHTRRDHIIYQGLFYSCFQDVLWKQIVFSQSSPTFTNSSDNSGILPSL